MNAGLSKYVINCQLLLLENVQFFSWYSKSTRLQCDTQSYFPVVCLQTLSFSSLLALRTPSLLTGFHKRFPLTEVNLSESRLF